MKGLGWLIMVLGVMAAISNFTGNTSLLQAAENNSITEAPKTIFDFKNELGLKDSQEDKLKAIMYDHQNSLMASTNKLKILNAELNQMITQKDDLAAIKNKLEEISKVQVSVSYQDIETSRKVENALTPAQLSQWKTIQKASAQKNQAAQ